MPWKTWRRHRCRPEGLILYLKTRCMGLPVLTGPLIKPSNEHSDQMNGIKSILQRTRQHSRQLRCHSFNGQKKGEKKKQHKCLQCEFSVSSYRCLLVNVFHLEWCSVFQEVCFAAETDRELPWKCSKGLRACVCEAKSPDSSNWLSPGSFPPARIMTKISSAPSCHTLGDPYWTESPWDRTATGSDRVILAWNKNTWVRQMDKTTMKTKSLLFVIIFSNFGAGGEVSIPELPLNI